MAKKINKNSYYYKVVRQRRMRDQAIDWIKEGFGIREKQTKKEKRDKIANRAKPIAEAIYAKVIKVNKDGSVNMRNYKMLARIVKERKKKKVKLESTIEVLEQEQKKKLKKFTKQKTLDNVRQKLKYEGLARPDYRLAVRKGVIKKGKSEGVARRDFAWITMNDQRRIESLLRRIRNGETIKLKAEWFDSGSIPEILLVEQKLQAKVRKISVG